MNFASPNGESDDGGEAVYEPHGSKTNDTSSAAASSSNQQRMLTGKEKIQELQQLLDEQTEMNNHYKRVMQEA